MGGLGSGHHLDPILRRLIYDHYVYRRKSPNEIHDILFAFDDSQKLTLQYLIKLCKWFDKSEEEVINSYLSGSRSRAITAGRPGRALLEQDREHLRILLRSCCTRKLREIADELYLMIDNEIDQMLSVPTVYRHLRDMNYTRKVFSENRKKLSYRYSNIYLLFLLLNEGSHEVQFSQGLRSSIRSYGGHVISRCKPDCFF